jgi:chromosome segregation ATPase
MNIANIKLPIAVIGVIVAQAFGIIWYVAQLDSTVSNLDTTVAEIQEQATTIDIAVLQTDLENIKEKLTVMDEIHSEKFDPSELEEAIEELEDRIANLETKDALIENEMRTIMSDHNNFNKALQDMGKSGYGDSREYGNYKD